MDGTGRKLRSWSESHIGQPLAEAAEQFNLSLPEVRRLLGPRAALHQFDGNHHNNVRSDEQLLADLSRFHSQTGDLTAAGFTRWARDDHDIPSHQAYIIRFGSWSAALRQAGVEGARGVKRSSRYSDDDLWEAVIEFFSSDQPSYSAESMGQWLQQRSAAPSMAYLRRRLGKFSEIKRTALDRITVAEDKQGR